MKTITTKYHACGNVRGTRISATDNDGNRVYVSPDDSANWTHGDTHKQAAKALCRKMDWHGELIQSQLRPGQFVYVWIDERKRPIHGMIPLLKLSVRSCFRIWIRTNREWDDRQTPGNYRTIPRYRRELCGFNAERWRRLYGRETIGKGIAEIFRNP